MGFPRVGCSDPCTRQDTAAATIGRVVVAAAGAAALAAPAAAGATTINVHPGKNAIQKAVNRASNGDALRIHDGRYKENVEVDKKVTLKDAGDGRPVVDGECDVSNVIDVDRSGVVVSELKVIGASDSLSSTGVDFTDLKRGTADDLVLRDTCGAGPNDGAGYGVNVYLSEKITVTDSNGKGFSDAAVYVGDISSTGNGQLVVAGNETFGNWKGIIVEDVAAPANVLVDDNDTHDNSDGIFVNRSDDVLFTNNLITGNATGVNLDDSDDNVFTDNTFTNNSANVDDGGTGNCGSGNSPEAFGPC